MTELPKNQAPSKISKDIRSYKRRKDKWSPVPNELWRAKVSDSAKCLWGYLHSQSIKFNPRYDQIHEETGKRRRSIALVLKELVENNMISIGIGKNNSNIYHLNEPTMWLKIIQLKAFGRSENDPTGRSENDPTNNTKNKTNNNTNIDKHRPVDKYKEVSDPIRDEIKEISNQIHPYTDIGKASLRLSYYLSKERKNPGKVIPSLLMALKAQNGSCKLPNGVRQSDGKLVFDDAFKVGFEDTIKKL